MVDENKKLLFTIGHSNQDGQKFLSLLSDNLIQVLVDIRSHPHSKFARQFNAATLKRALADKGIKYLYLGRELGGKPSDPSLYDEEGHALYDLMAQSPSFLKAIQRLLEGLKRYRIALMCSEEDPSECHRHLLIGRVMELDGVQVLHLRADGRVQPNAQIIKNSAQESSQLSLFPEQKEGSWRSAKSIRLALQNGVPNNSSKLSRKPG